MRLAPLALVAFLAAGFVILAQEPGEATPEAALELGAAIYQRGEAATLQEVLIGDPPSRAPLALFACRGCHGDDGQGAEEGGVVAPRIRWSYLSKPYSVRGGPFRLRPAYDEELFARALREGVDSAGNKFGIAMPRYPLSEGEIAALIAYLRGLDQAERASPFGREIPIGVRLPRALEGKTSRQNEVLRATIETYFEVINRRGGIFERQIRLRFHGPSDPFASGLAAGLDLSIPQPGEENLPMPADAVPVIALFPTIAGQEPQAERFTLYAGPDDRAAVLRLFARRQLGLEDAAIATVGEDAAPPTPGQVPVARAVVYAGRDAMALRKALERLPNNVTLLLAGWLESPELMELAKHHAGPVYVATPPTSHLLGESGRQMIARLEAVRPLPAERHMVQLWALAAARTLETALEKAGRDLRPQALPRIFESFSRFETGFGPDLRFSPARHLGARGAVVLRLGPGKEAIADWQWLELDR